MSTLADILIIATYILTAYGTAAGHWEVYDDLHGDERLWRSIVAGVLWPAALALVVMVTVKWLMEKEKLDR